MRHQAVQRAHKSTTLAVLILLLFITVIVHETTRGADTMSRTMHLSAVGLVLTYYSTISVNAFVPSIPRTVMVPPFKYGTSSMIRSSSSTRLFFGDFFNFDKKKEEAVKEEEEESYDDAAYDDSDPVEKMFSFFFGKREEAPMGMARFGKDRFPEQYPAVLDEWAEPLASDDKEMAVLRPFLKNTNLENRGLQLTYDANRDGWDAEKFHQCVDKKGGAIVCCTTRMGIVAGGYNPKGWVGYGEARGSIAAFLYIVGGPYAKAGAPGIKLRKVGGAGMAQMDNPENGPCFGADSLVIPLGENDSKLARSKLGSYYERLPDGTNTVFGKDSSVQLRDMKVYHGVYEEGEYIPFTDAEPFALY